MEDELLVNAGVAEVLLVADDGVVVLAAFHLLGQQLLDLVLQEEELELEQVSMERENWIRTVLKLSKLSNTIHPLRLVAKEIKYRLQQIHLRHGLLPSLGYTGSKCSLDKKVQSPEENMFPSFGSEHAGKPGLCFLENLKRLI